MCFYLKNFRGLLAVECNFWKPRTAPSTEQVHVIHDHRIYWRDPRIFMRLAFWSCTTLRQRPRTLHPWPCVLRQCPHVLRQCPRPRAMWTPPAPVMGLPPHPASTP
jgi:hypothetical protein